MHPDRGQTGKFARELGVNDVFYADTRLQTFAAANGLEALTLAPVMQVIGT